MPAHRSFRGGQLLPVVKTVPPAGEMTTPAGTEERLSKQEADGKRIERGPTRPWSALDQLGRCSTGGPVRQAGCEYEDSTCEELGDRAAHDAEVRRSAEGEKVEKRRRWMAGLIAFHLHRLVACAVSLWHMWSGSCCGCCTSRHHVHSES